MITVTRRGGGTSFALNPDLIERLEQTSDADGTVITLVSGTQYVVADTVEQIVAEVRRFRAAVLTATTDPPPANRPPANRAPGSGGPARRGRLQSVAGPE